MKPSLLMQLLFVLFVGLKISSVIEWSWWAVFAPLWAPALAWFVFGFVFGFIDAYRAVNSRKDKVESV